MSSKETGQTVKRRRVFYIPGYDPFHPRRYRELYRSEGATQASISGYEIGLKPKTTKGPYGWHVISVQDGQRVETDVEVLYWSDIVKQSMSNSILATYLQLARTAWIYISSGALFRLMRLRKGPVIAALYPVGMLLGQLALALLSLWVCIRLASFIAPWITAPGATMLGVGTGIAAAIAMLRWFRARDGKFFAYYLMHDYAHT
ncbi:hypothetical protein AB9K41_14130, partial [Cribrihabitans sp. XS_ASV171]